jgi:hypothetical protein
LKLQSIIGLPLRCHYFYEAGVMNPQLEDLKFNTLESFSLPDLGRFTIYLPKIMGEARDQAY